MRKERDDIAAKLEEQLAVPPFPAAAGHAWAVWQRLRRRKGSGANGLLPIEWPDLDAFARMSGAPLYPFDVELIEELDDLFLKKMTEEIKPLDGSDLKSRLKELGRKPQKGA